MALPRSGDKAFFDREAKAVTFKSATTQIQQVILARLFSTLCGLAFEGVKADPKKLHSKEFHYSNHSDSLTTHAKLIHFALLLFDESCLEHMPRSWGPERPWSVVAERTEKSPEGSNRFFVYELTLVDPLKVLQTFEAAANAPGKLFEDSVCSGELDATIKKELVRLLGDYGLQAKLERGKGSAVKPTEP